LGLKRTYCTLLQYFFQISLRFSKIYEIKKFLSQISSY
jgi:hypothetical protein